MNAFELGDPVRMSGTVRKAQITASPNTLLRYLDHPLPAESHYGGALIDRGIIVGKRTLKEGSVIRGGYEEHTVVRFDRGATTGYLVAFALHRKPEQLEPLGGPKCLCGHAPTTGGAR